MWSTPALTASRNSRTASSRSGGGPNTPGPVRRIAPKPMGVTWKAPRGRLAPPDAGSDPAGMLNHPPSPRTCRAVWPAALLEASRLHADDLPQRRQRLAPPDDLTEQGVERLGLVRAGSQLGEVLEVGEQGQSDIRADVCHLELAGDEAEVLGCPGAADGAVGDDAHGLVVPLRVQEVDEIG